VVLAFFKQIGRLLG